MLIVYEKEEGFFKKLEMITDKANARVFVSRVRDVDQAGVINPTILVQALVGGETIMVRYKGDMPRFQIMTFDAIENDMIRDQAQKDYDAKYMAFEQQLEAEYNKMLNLIKTMGYMNIENAVITS